MARWNQKAFDARPGLSSIVGKAVRVERAPKDTADWRNGRLRVIDVETGEILSTVGEHHWLVPDKTWPLKLDC